MAEYLIQDTTLKGIADAVREKTGKSDLIPVGNLANEIANISSGGVKTCTVTITTPSYRPVKYSYTAYENSVLIVRADLLNYGGGTSIVTLENVVCGSAITIIDSGADPSYSNLSDNTMKFVFFQGGNVCVSAPTNEVSATVNLGAYID